LNRRRYGRFRLGKIAGGSDFLFRRDGFCRLGNLGSRDGCRLRRFSDGGCNSGRGGSLRGRNDIRSGWWLDSCRLLGGTRLSFAGGLGDGLGYRRLDHHSYSGRRNYDDRTRCN
jgi:hypothetical protein